MSFWLLVLGWVALVATLYVFSSFLESRAAMRGTHRTPLPAWVDKGIRIFFLLALVSPGLLLLPYLLSVPLFLLYVPTYLDNCEKTGKRNSEWFKSSSVFGYVQRYFNLSIINANGNKQLEEKRQYIIGVHPHGLLPVGSLIATLTNVADAKGKLTGNKSIRLIVASFCFYIPFYRDFLLACGVLDAARYNARAAIDAGHSLVLIPGGATEGLHAHPGKHILILERRKGFVKLAIETGCDLLPAYGFGENNCYDQLSTKLPFVRKFQAKFQKILGLSCPLVTNIIPRRTDITVVFGRPVPVKKIEKPTAAEVDAIHALYVAELTRTFNEYAPTLISNPKERVLQII